MAGRVTSKGSASLATVLSPAANREIICLRIGFDSAEKVTSSRVRSLPLTKSICPLEVPSQACGQQAVIREESEKALAARRRGEKLQLCA